MKTEIIELLESFDYNLVQEEQLDDDVALIFEGPILSTDKYAHIIEKLSEISNDMEFMMFKVDQDTMMFAVFTKSMKYMVADIGSSYDKYITNPSPEISKLIDTICDPNNH